MKDIFKVKNKFRLLTAFCLSLLFFCLFALSACGEKTLEDISQNLSTYNLSVTFDESDNTLCGTETVNYKNNYETTLSCVKFHLYPNAFRQGATYSPVSLRNFDKAYENGFSAGEIDISSVSVDGKSIEVEIEGNDENILNVDLFQEIFPGEGVSIQIVFEVLLPNCVHRFGYGDNTYNFGNFYPIACVFENGEFVQDNYGSNGDPFYSETANYNVTISCDDDFTLASSGTQKSKSVENGNIVTTISASAVRDFAFVLSKKFSVISENVDGVTVSYYYYDDENALKSLQTGVKAIKTFSNLFGSYPYETYSVVKTNFIHGGMEYPNLVYISDTVESYDDYLNVIVHETAHQWWYNMVGSNACEYAWLDEGLTEFSTLMFYRYNDGYNVVESDSLNASLSSYILFSEIYESVYGNFDASMSRNVNDFSGEMEYTYISYVKGVLFFDNLEKTAGEKNFLKALKHYFKENKFTNAIPDDLISSFEVTTKRNLEGFFNSWINGKVILQNYH
ncbi:MAG: M1 family peptidase [Clostridia bacterium]|nr:M1 family peptidase [Clostridia bacterium]